MASVCDTFDHVPMKTLKILEVWEKKTHYKTVKKIAFVLEVNSSCIQFVQNKKLIFSKIPHRKKHQFQIAQNE